MKARRFGFVFAVVCVVALAFATGVFAAEEGGSAAQEKATEIFKWINFAILAAVFLWVGLKKLPGVFRSRVEQISSAITKATAAKAEADRILRDAEAKLGRLDQEIAELRAQGQKDAAIEVERIRAMAKSDVEKIGAAAKLEIEAAERAARIELKRTAAKLAVDGAESLLKKELTPKSQDALIGEFVKELQGSAN